MRLKYRIKEYYKSLPPTERRAAISTLSEQLGLSESRVYALMNLPASDTRVIEPNELAHFAAFFEVSVADLINDEVKQMYLDKSDEYSHLAAQLK